MGDDLARQRRELPWVRVEKEYSFETDEGTRTLTELFNGRSQLLVYHFMFGPTYEAGCPACSSNADAVNGVVPHLNEKLRAYERRMGWTFPWVSSADSDFNFDFGMSRTEEQTREAFKPMIEAGIPPILDHLATASGTDVVGYLSEGPGFSSFVRDEGAVFHAYSTTARGLEFLMGYYPILDRAPKGRNEADAPLWLRRHDEYEHRVT